MCGAIVVSFFAIIPLAKVNHCFSPRNNCLYVLVARFCDRGTITSRRSDARWTYKCYSGTLQVVLTRNCRLQLNWKSYYREMRKPWQTKGLRPPELT